MSDKGRLFTSESVTEGHPDKICDAISDSVLDALLEQDPTSRVAVETLVTTGQVHVVGEVTTSAYADIPAIVRNRILDIGYDSSTKGFDGASCGVNVAIGAQSPDIAQGVDTQHLVLRSQRHAVRQIQLRRRSPIQFSDLHARQTEIQIAQQRFHLLLQRGIFVEENGRAVKTMPRIDAPHLHEVAGDVRTHQMLRDLHAILRCG